MFVFHGPTVCGIHPFLDLVQYGICSMYRAVHMRLICTARSKQTEVRVKWEVWALTDNVTKWHKNTVSDNLMKNRLQGH